MTDRELAPQDYKKRSERLKAKVDNFENAFTEKVNETLALEARVQALEATIAKFSRAWQEWSDKGCREEGGANYERYRSAAFDSLDEARALLTAPPLPVSGVVALAKAGLEIWGDLKTHEYYDDEYHSPKSLHLAQAVEALTPAEVEFLKGQCDGLA